MIVTDVAWHKSTHSATNGSCVEWRKSTRCFGGSDCVEFRTSSYCESGSCVEFRHDEVVVQVRDSKDKEGPILSFDERMWNDFTGMVKRGSW